MAQQQLIPLEVFDEDTQTAIVFQLNAEAHARAMNDPDFLRGLRDAHFAAAAQDDDVLINEWDENGDEPEPQPSTGPTSPSSSVFLWTEAMGFLLITLYEEYLEEFKSGKTRHNVIWDKVAEQIVAKNPQLEMAPNKPPTGAQCQSKFNGLKKTYKKIVDHNSISGNNRKTWPYFERMHEIFATCGWVEPKALATEAQASTSSSSSSSSSSNGPPAKKVKTEVVLEQLVQNLKKDREERDKAKQEKREALYAQAQAERERRHQETIRAIKEMTDAIKQKRA